MDPIEEITKIKDWIKEFLDANEAWHQIDKNKMEAVKESFDLDTEQTANVDALIAKEDIYLSKLEGWRNNLDIN